jgi:hypothetical protein
VAVRHGGRLQRPGQRQFGVDERGKGRLNCNMKNDSPKCIYCCDSKGAFGTKEHFFPESLGGGEWSVLPDGCMCDKCQNYFGSKVEQPVLSDWPFCFVRLIMAIPTKTKKAPKMNTNLGSIAAFRLPGYFQPSFDVRVNPPLEIPASPRDRRLVCRALVKMAIGSLVSSDSVDIFAERFKAARQFTRYGDAKIKWWYLEQVNLKAMMEALKLGADARKETVKLETVYLDGISAFFHLKYFFLKIVTPIEPQFEMDLPQELPEGTHIYRV